jgi:hypothetical protein
MKAIERLEQIKEIESNSITSDRFVSLTNPKNVVMMETLIAWTCTPIEFLKETEVDNEATLQELWTLCNINIKELSETAGLTINETMVKIKQLRNLGLIYPDGTAHSNAINIIRIYVKGRVEKL